MSLKANCWDYKKCDKELRNNCPAYPNAGRVCFVIEGTRCDGQLHGPYSQKINDCRGCRFYKDIVISDTAKLAGAGRD